MWRRLRPWPMVRDAPLRGAPHHEGVRWGDRALRSRHGETCRDGCLWRQIGYTPAQIFEKRGGAPPGAANLGMAETTVGAVARPQSSIQDVLVVSFGHALTHWYPATFYLLLPLIGAELGLS